MKAGRQGKGDLFLRANRSPLPVTVHGGRASCKAGSGGSGVGTGGIDNHDSVHVLEGLPGAIARATETKRQDRHRIARRIWQFRLYLK